MEPRPDTLGIPGWIWQTISVLVLVVHAPWALSLSILLLSGDEVVSVRLPPSERTVWFQCLVVEKEAGWRALEVVVPACGALSSTSRGRPADDAVSCYAFGERPPDATPLVVWQDADRIGLLRKHGPDDWSIRWIARESIRWTRRALDTDIPHLDVDLGTAPSPAGLVDGLRLSRARRWSPNRCW